MKKIISILFIVILGAAACNKTEFTLEKPADGEASGLVAVTMQLKVPQLLEATTRASNRSHNPQIDYIKVAVFGISGYPQAYALAEPVNEAAQSISQYATTNGDTYYFKVLLPVYEGEAHVHIIANGDESIPFVDQDEESIMLAMNTTNNVGAYWARIVLPDGIRPQKDTDGIMQTDTEHNFIPDTQTANAFKNLVLVRNFAEVALILDPDALNLHEVSWTLMNVPTKGSVAPIASNVYVDDYASYEYNGETGKMEKGGTAYDGYLFPGAIINDTIPTPARIAESVDNPLFVYERPKPTGSEKATCIMLKAKYHNDSDFSYYRLDLMDEKVGGYFPIYRNYRYQVKIMMVGNRGASSPEEASLRDSGGNVSMSTEAQSLTDISDGVTRLYVEYTEKNFTNGGKKSVWVQYSPDATSAAFDNTKLTFKVLDDENTEHPALKEGSTVGWRADSNPNGYYFLEFELNDQAADYDQVSTIQIKADSGDPDRPSTLYRNITLRVIKTMDMYLSLYPKKVDTGTGKRTVLSIELPENLPSSMFPLEIYIEDVNHTLNPTGSDGGSGSIIVPVKVDKSLVDESNSFYFVRTVNESEYQRSNIIKTQFETMKAASATTLYVDNEYFNMKSTNLLNDGIYVNPTSSTVAFNVTSVDVEVDTDGNAAWSVTVPTGSPVTVSPTSGTGTGSFSMTIPLNNSTTASPSYSVTVTSGSYSQVVTINQRPLEFTLDPSSQTIIASEEAVNVTVHAEDGKAWTASVSGPNGTNPTLSATSGVGTAILTVNLPANTTTNQRLFTVTAEMTDPDATTTATIYQRRVPNNYSEFSYNAFGNSFSGSASATSSDGYVTVDLANCYKASGNSYIRTSNGSGYGAGEYGSITITPIDGMKITTVVVTYAERYVDNNPRISTGSINVSGNQVTWTVNSSNSVTYTSSNNSIQNNNARRMTNIRVNYEPISD